jgi:hypothetical protein
VKLSIHQAEVFEEYLLSDGWLTVLIFLGERLEQKQNALKSGRLSHEEYLEACAAIRELEYLRDEPARLVRNSYKESKDGNRPFGDARRRGSGNGRVTSR